MIIIAKTLTFEYKTYIYKFSLSNHSQFELEMKDHKSIKIY